MRRENLIVQVLDSSHAKWVQGGVFKDLRNASNAFGNQPIYLPPLNSIQNFVIWFLRSWSLRSYSVLLFSSLTPLENFLRFPLQKKKQKLGLWYTHKDGEYSNQEKAALRRANVIFAHSKNEIKKIREVSQSLFVEMLAGIDPKRFSEPSISGSEILWAGTPVHRKNPELFLSITKGSQELNFRLIGSGWMESEFASEVLSSPNLKYVEFQGPLKSQDMDGCGIFLMTSRLEGGPMPLLESLASGLVPICTKTGFVEELYQLLELPNELLVEPDVNSFISAIKWVRERNFVISESQRLKILELNFQRLATIIESNLI
jgi:glycosyltransferase involved in cell wall biosynthesis